MNTAKRHYDDLLADLYSWMLGDFDARVEAQHRWLRTCVGEQPAALRPPALDLGAGAGADAIALARLGYGVVAVDANAKLVAEARRRVVDAGFVKDVAVVEGDLLEILEEKAADPIYLAVCLGDTLTHLESAEAVQRMFRAARARIAEGGRFVVSYRDLSEELRDVERFFLVRSDAKRILTCFVEYTPAHAVVHDVVHTRTHRGWEMRASAYPKLRLPVDHVRRWLGEAGFHLVERVPCGGGLVALMAR